MTRKPSTALMASSAKEVKSHLPPAFHRALGPTSASPGCWWVSTVPLLPELMLGPVLVLMGVAATTHPVLFPHQYDLGAFGNGAVVGTKMGFTTALAFNGREGWSWPQSPWHGCPGAAFPAEAKLKAMAYRRDGCSQRLRSLVSLQWAASRMFHFFSKNVWEKLVLVVGQGLHGGCNPNKAEVKGCSGRGGAAVGPSWAGAEGQARTRLGGLCLEVAAQHMHRRWEKARQKYQMSWSNICTTFPAFTKKAFYTQSTLGDELGKQRGGSPLKLTLWLCTDKASASSSLM